MSRSIQQLEIFGAGTHKAATGKITVTTDDLDAIVDAFNSLKGTNIVRPHLKLGHTEAQKWFGQENGIPALGWIEKVWREGTKLLANVSDVPNALVDLIRQRRFHNVSAEVFWDQPIEHEGRKYSRVLSAVAILGTEMPAVKDLAGLAEALFQAEPATFEGGEITAITMEGEMPSDSPKPALFSQEQVDTLIAAAVDKAVAAVKAEAEEASASLSAELEVAKNRADEAEAKIAEVQASAAKTEAEAIVTAAIKEGKLAPKHKDFAVGMLTAADAKLSFADGEKSMKEAFKEFLSEQKVIATEDKSVVDPADREKFSTAAQELDVKVRKFMAAEKVDYAAAMTKVMELDPNLRARYAEETS